MNMMNFTLKACSRCIIILVCLLSISNLAWSQCNDLFFSQYIEGSGNNKCLEIYNPTSSTITLDNYQIRIFSNGNPGPGANVIIGWIPSTPGGNTIAAGASYVICNPGQALGLTPNRSTGSISFNGNDVVTLNNLSTVIDALGQLGNSANYGADVHWIRKSSVLEGDMDETDAFSFAGSGEWDAGTADDGTGFGSHTFDGCPTATPPPLAFTGFHSDTPDQFSFVVLQDYSAGDVLFFTDNGWFAAGGFRATEGVITLTFTCDVDCGAHVVVSTQGDIDAKVGTESVAAIVNSSPAFSLATSGDQIFAFTGDLVSPNILAGIHFNGSSPGWDADATSSNTSALPPSLTEGLSAHGLVEADNGTYSCGTLSGTALEIAQAVNVSTGWSTSNGTISIGTCGNFMVTGCGTGDIDCPIPPDPTPLCLGDIAFTGWQSDGDDMFSFIILKDIGAGTDINFTDNGWFNAGGFRATENTMTLTFSVPLSCGSEVKIDRGTSMATDPSGNPVGTISGSIPNLSAGGDQIFAYQGPAPTAGNEAGFLAALHYSGAGWNVEASSSNTSAKPCVFVDGVTSISFNHVDNGIHGCSSYLTSLTPAMIRGMVYNPNSWSTNNEISFTYPPDCGYTCSTCTFPMYYTTFSDVNNTCPGDPVELTVIGVLNDATQWVWYTECCGGGTQAGIGSSITVNPTVSTTYYVRGEGGCVDVDKCQEVEVTVIVDNEPPVAVCMGHTVTFNGEDELFFDETDVWDDGASSDNCGVVNFSSLSQYSVLCTAVGSDVPVTVTVTDFSGNPGSCVATVTVDGLPCGFDQTNINCNDPSSSSYDPNTGTYQLTTDCYAPGYYRPTDAHALIRTELCGDGEIIAQVTDVMGNGWAGITMREGTGPSDKMIQLLIDGSFLTRRELRVSTGGTAFAHIFQTQGRNWLRLTRSGNTFGAFHSTDGVSWQPVLITNIVMSSCIDIGLIATSGSSSAPVTGVFENVQVIESGMPLVAPKPGFDIAETPLQSLELFPNPATDEVNVKLHDFIGHEINISIFNVSGQLVKQLQLDEVYEGVQNIDVSTLNNGTYLLRIESAEKVVSEKFVIAGK